MGTNYYARQTCGTSACDHCAIATQHIGKTSMGWVFAARWHDEQSAPVAPVRNDAELRALIFGESIRVFDEYGREHQPASLWENILGRRGLRRAGSAVYAGLSVTQSDVVDYCAYDFS